MASCLIQERLQDLTNKYDEVAKIEKDISESNVKYVPRIKSYHHLLPLCPAMHESTRQELVRSKEQLESKLEQVFSGTKAELHEEHEQHLSVVERSSSELEDVSWGGGEREREGE